MDKDGKLTREKSKAVNKIGHGALPSSSPSPSSESGHHAGLHMLDPLFRKVTLENERLKALVRDLKFHRDPVGESSLMRFSHSLFVLRTPS